MSSQRIAPPPPSAEAKAAVQARVESVATKAIQQAINENGGYPQPGDPKDKWGTIFDRAEYLRANPKEINEDLAYEPYKRKGGRRRHTRRHRKSRSTRRR